MDAVLLILAFALFLLLPFAIAKLWMWFWFWVTIGVSLSIFEIIAYLKTKKTLSQQFWSWIADDTIPKWKKIIIFIGMVGFWGFLLIHLFVR